MQYTRAWRIPVLVLVAGVGIGYLALSMQRPQHRDVSKDAAEALQRPIPDEYLRVRSVMDVPGVSWISDFAVLPRVIAVIDQNSPKTPRVLFFDRATRQLIVSFPDAMTSTAYYGYPFRLFIDHALPSRVWAVDSRTRSVYAFDTEPTIRLAERWYVLPREVRADARPAWLTAERLAISQDVPEGFLQILRVTASGQELQPEIAGGVEPFEHDPGRAAAAHLTRGILGTLRKPDQIVMAFRYFSRIDYYDERLRRRASVGGPVPVDVTYNVVPGPSATSNAFHKPQTRWTYVDVATGDDFVYCLFSGHTWGGPTRLYLAKDIHVFDREGRMVRIGEVPEYLYSIKVETGTQSLFGVGRRPAAILEFDLPGGTDQARRSPRVHSMFR